MLKIAITGGAGSGKSTVARMFKELGAAVLDADQAARDAVAVGTPAWQELRRLFGEDFFNQNGTLNRSRLAERVFTDPEARRHLEALIHPLVAQELQNQVADLERQGVDLVLVEVPLLFESGRESVFDRVIVVTAQETDQIRRLRSRDHRGEKEIRGILESQWPLADKVARADYVVDNGGKLSFTRQQVQSIWEKLQKIPLTAGAKKVSVPSNLP
ncbi:MAG: dephospho-CoA kinase [Thermodesulfobacteriota bacterium]